LNFADNNKIGKSSTTAVANNVYYRIIQGPKTSKGRYFYPQGKVSLAHLAMYFYRMDFTITTGKRNSVDPDPAPPIEDDTTYYFVGHIKNGSVVKDDKKYTSYKAAESAYTAQKTNTLIFKGDKIIKTRNAAIAYVTDRTANGDTSTIYLDKDFKRAFTYVAEGSELAYSGSNETYTTVKVGDVVGYAKTSELTIQPLAILKNRSYYYVSNGHLIHKIYNYATGSYSGDYQTGNAPSFMKAGQKYYSIDGVQFKNSAGKVVGKYYNYYQFASVRKYTNYTAKELDNIINVLLAERQKLNPSKYKDATKKSKIIGLGKFLKEVEAEYKVNALFILATAMHESDYGMSVNAQTKNNLFGIRVFDSSPQDGSKYKKPEDSVYAFMNEYINKNYVPQSGSYANGAVPGTKNTGINVYYASDAFWGSKIAGHMYRIDERFGKKEYKSAKSIGMVVNGGKAVPVYKSNSTKSKVMFTYKAKPLGSSGLFGFPVIIMETKKGTDGKTWYKVFSDNHPKSGNFTRYVWIPANHVKKITTK
ncbi:MAG: glucosaminidase domain-containing protein, partial [Lysinibacillus sp.]